MHSHFSLTRTFLSLSGGYSLDRVDKKLGKALGRAVYVHGLSKLHLSANAFRTLDEALGWLLADVVDTVEDTALSEIFVDSNIIRAVDWPPTSFAGISGCLAHLDLSKNKIRTIDVISAPLPQPITFGGLEWLDLSGNINLWHLLDGLFATMPNLKRFVVELDAVRSHAPTLSLVRSFVLQVRRVLVCPQGRPR